MSSRGCAAPSPANTGLPAAERPRLQACLQGNPAANFADLPDLLALLLKLSPPDRRHLRPL